MRNYYFTVILLLLNNLILSAKETNTPIFDFTITKNIGTPRNLMVSNLSIKENEPSNTSLGIISAESSNPNEVFTYYLTDPFNDPDPDKYNNDKFVIVDNELQSAQTFDFETKNEYLIKLGVRNQFGEKVESEFIVTIEDVAIEDLVTIEITDTVLEDIRYSQSFSQPTRLVFTNLTKLTLSDIGMAGSISFSNNVNLVEVEFPKLTLTEVGDIAIAGGEISFSSNPNLEKISFPLLEETGNAVSFSSNPKLKIIDVPNLTTIYSYLRVRSNLLLEEFNICNLEEIKEIPFGASIEPSTYYISDNNPIIDTNPQCFSLGAPENLVASNLSIKENEAPNTTIGLLSANSNYPNGALSYYLTDPFDPGNDPDITYENNKFTIVDNALKSKQSFDFEVKNEFLIKLGVRNQLGESLEKEFTIIIEDVAIEDLVTIEITDTVLEDIRYSQSFSQPTRLVFTNLTKLTLSDIGMAGSISFSNNINLVEVEFPKLTLTEIGDLGIDGGEISFSSNPNLEKISFPLLEETGNAVSFSSNPKLKIIDVPNLTTIHSYLRVRSNLLLEEFNICNLKEIKEIPFGAYIEPSTYYISDNNPIIDTNPQCFSLGAPENLMASNLSIKENEAPNTTIGLLSANSNYPNGALSYYLTDPFDPGNDPDITYENNKFTIVDNALKSKQTFDFEAKNEFLIKLGVRNQLGESLEKEFTIIIEDVAIEDLVTIEITDTVLEDIRYSQSFSQPTRLVFTNLTKLTKPEFGIAGSISFSNNVNLVEVEFPKLTLTEIDELGTVGGEISFSSNPNLVKIDFPLLKDTGNYISIVSNPKLEIVNAPSLESAHHYLDVSRNPLLKELNICKLSEISPSNDPIDNEPYFKIKNNPNLDFDTTCLTDTEITFNRVPEIIIQPAPNTIVGSFTSDAGPDANIRYYFVDDEGKETTNEDFIIFGENVYLAKEYDEYTETDFTLEVNADRLIVLSLTDRNNNRPPTINEKIELTFTVNIENATLSVDTISNEEQVTLFPNPAKNYIQIDSKIIFESIKVFDLTGKYIKRLNANENKYNTEAISAGLYILELKEKNNLNTYYKKLVIE